jgi:hypothetical protein
MAELTRRATTLIKEMLTADGKLPVYNVSVKSIRYRNIQSAAVVHVQPGCLALSFLPQEEVVRQVLQQIDSHQNGMTQVIRSVRILSGGFIYCWTSAARKVNLHMDRQSSCSVGPGRAAAKIQGKAA